MVEKFDDMRLHLHRIPQRAGRTDGQTDRDGKNNIAWCMLCMLMHDKKKCTNIIYNNNAYLSYALQSFP